MVAEELLIEKAIEQALKPDTKAAPVQKKAYQARYEITALDGNAIVQQELNFGPTIISTRRNFFLTNSFQAQWWTMGDYFDGNDDANPDIVVALQTFQNSNNPAPYLALLRQRASGQNSRLNSRVDEGALQTATIDLINLIRMDGLFSQTNQLLSPCFSATDEAEFVFETLVGLDESQFATGAQLTAIPTQTSGVLLAGSTALSNDDTAAPADDRNLFYDSNNNNFIETFSIELFLNLVPNQVIPGADNIAAQGHVIFTDCAQFNYFN